MTDGIDDLVKSINVNQILIAILEEKGSVTIPTTKFLDAEVGNKELIIDYNEEGPTFTFSLRERTHTHEDGTSHTHD